MHDFALNPVSVRELEIRGTPNLFIDEKKVNATQINFASREELRGEAARLSRAQRIRSSPRASLVARSRRSSPPLLAIIVFLSNSISPAHGDDIRRNKVFLKRRLLSGLSLRARPDDKDYGSIQRDKIAQFAGPGEPRSCIIVARNEEKNVRPSESERERGAGSGRGAARRLGE